MIFFEKVTCTKNILKPNNINALYWAFYYVNDNKEINIIILQVMHCILCYNNPIWI
jgi:hypothetical protein